MVSPEAPTAFVITGQDDRRLLLAAADQATRDEWIRRVQGVISSFFFSPHSVKGSIELSNADSVRKSEAPRAPPFSLDIVSHGGNQIFTLCPPSKEEQLRWVCVLAKAISTVKEGHGRDAAVAAARTGEAAAEARPKEESTGDDDAIETRDGRSDDDDEWERVSARMISKGDAGGADVAKMLARLADAEARAAAAEAKLATPRLQLLTSNASIMPAAPPSLTSAVTSTTSLEEMTATARNQPAAVRIRSSRFLAPKREERPSDARAPPPTLVSTATSTTSLAPPPTLATIATSTATLAPPTLTTAASVAGLPPPPPLDAPREEQMTLLHAQEKVVLQSLRALRSRLAALKAEEDADQRAKVQELKQAAACQIKAMGSASRAAGVTSAVEEPLIVIPASGTTPIIAAGGGFAARTEARAINAELELGRLVLFRYDPASVAATKLKPSGKPGGGQDVLSYSVHDPTDLDLIDLGGTSTADKRGLALQKQYDEWRRQFSVKTEAAAWRRGLETLQARQLERYLATLTLLEVEHPDQAAVALFRLHDYPGEFTTPLKFGDVLLAWSPLRDQPGGLTFADRATVNAATVGLLAQWLEQHRGAMGRMYRADCSSTDQSEESSVAFAYVHRKLFQTARVL